jgi:hypothetical protein
MTFCTDLTPRPRHWPVGPWPGQLPRWQDQSTLLTAQCDYVNITEPHRLNLNSMIQFELDHVVVWNRTRRSKWSYGYQRRWFLVIGTSPAACPSGGACRWPVREFYWMRGKWWSTLGWSEAHPDAEELASEVAGGRTREIVGVQSSRCRDCRRRLGASQLVGLDEEKEEITAELWSYSATLWVVSSDGERFGRS